MNHGLSRRGGGGGGGCYIQLNSHVALIIFEVLELAVLISLSNFFFDIR